MTTLPVLLPPEIIAAAGRGWRLFPVKDGDKKPPLLKDWPAKASSDLSQLEAWATRFPGCNWGLACGPDSGVYALDIDGDAGKASVAEWERSGLLLPSTRTHKTPRGLHLLFRWPAGFNFTISGGKLGPGLDERGDRGYILAPPSLHPSGHRYECLDEDVPLAEMPPWLIKLHEKPVQTSKPTGPTPCHANTRGSRTTALTKDIGALLRRKFPVEAIEAAMLATNRIKNDPPLPESKVIDTVHDMAKRYRGPEPSGVTTAPAEPITPDRASTLAAELLTTIKSWITGYVIVSEEQATILAVWVLHTYVLAAADITPYLHITAAEKECGKSLLMDVLAAVACNPIRSGGMTAAALVRTVDAHEPTLFLDEMDAAMGGDKEYAEAQRCILNEGFHRGGTFYKCDGKNHDLRAFNVYCCKAFAGIGSLPDTVASRSIMIEMRRKLPTEIVKSFRHKAVRAEAAPIAAALENWGRSAGPYLQNLTPAPIAGLGDRQNDIAEPLLAIAGLAGGEWCQSLTDALRAVYGSSSAEAASDGATLLRDIRDIFDERLTEKISSKDLAECLCGIEGRPWAEWSRGRPISPNQIARILKRFSIHPQTIRTAEGTPKGYRRADFEDAWARYCPLPLNSTATTPQPASPLAEPRFSNGNTPASVAVANSASKPHEQRGVAAVAVGQRGERAMAIGI